MFLVKNLVVERSGKLQRYSSFQKVLILMNYGHRKREELEDNEDDEE